MGQAEGKSRKSRQVVSPDLIEPLEALQQLISDFENRGVVIGGIAASILGQPRLTVDLDAVILLSVGEIPELLQKANQEGIKPRTTDAVAFARRNRVLLLIHEKTGVNIDISLGTLRN